MRVIFTSDLHLKKDRPERFAALNEILNIGSKEKVHYIIIGGDLFDSAHDARSLRPELRQRLSDNKIPILVIPGNHDHDCFIENLDFGENLTPLVERPFTVIKKEQCQIVAVPYFEGDLGMILPNLTQARDKKMKSLLVIHGSLDLTGFSRLDFGAEKEVRYLPITEGMIKELGYHYILAGHYHTEPLRRQIGRTRFFYSGSPVVITRREVGRRHVYLIDTEDEAKLIPLNTRYYQPIELTVFPGEEKQVLVSLKKMLAKHDQNLADLEVTIKGFIKVGEKDFGGIINVVAGSVKVNKEYRQVSDLISEPLYSRIRKKLDGMKINPDLRRRVEEMFIEALIR